MVDAYHHHVFLCQGHARIPCRGARVESTTMEPHHHRLPGLCVGSPDIEHATVLLRHLIFGERPAMSRLHGLRSPVVAHPYGVPTVDGCRWHKPFHLGVRNAQESHRPFLVDALHLSRDGLHHGGGVIGRSDATVSTLHADRHRQQQYQQNERFLHKASIKKTRQK